MSAADVVPLLVSLVNGGFLALTAKMGYDIRGQATENGNVTRQVQEQLNTVDQRTNGELDRKIRSAVTEVFRDHRTEVTEAVMAESVRHLLDAMIGGDDHHG